MMFLRRIIIIGAGPAGMMAAIQAAESHGEVLLLEKNSAPGRKLLLTGNGRCNFTNACPPHTFREHYFHGSRFLRSAFGSFPASGLMDFFATRGVASIVRDGGRVLPRSLKSQTILDVLQHEMRQRGVHVRYRAAVRRIVIQGTAVRGVTLSGGEEVPGDAVIIAAGGASYPATGSDGAGFSLAQAAGHTIVPPRPGLVPLVVKETVCADLEGIALPGVVMTFRTETGKPWIQTGDIIFTRDGISGPAVLSASSAISEWLGKKPVKLSIDIRPDRCRESIERDFLSAREQHARQHAGTLLARYIPQRMSVVMLALSGIDTAQPLSHLKREARTRIIDSIKALPLTVVAPRPIAQAMITQGGVALSEIDPHTMESRITRGLYCAGEVLDIDGDTGGFNLQAAFSTGYAAGSHAGRMPVPHA